MYMYKDICVQERAYDIILHLEMKKVASHQYQSGMDFRSFSKPKQHSTEPIHTHCRPLRVNMSCQSRRGRRCRDPA